MADRIDHRHPAWRWPPSWMFEPCRESPGPGRERLLHKLAVADDGDVVRFGLEQEKSGRHADRSPRQPVGGGKCLAFVPGHGALDRADARTSVLSSMRNRLRVPGWNASTSIQPWVDPATTSTSCAAIQPSRSRRRRTDDEHLAWAASRWLGGSARSGGTPARSARTPSTSSSRPTVRNVTSDSRPDSSREVVEAEKPARRASSRCVQPSITRVVRINVTTGVCKSFRRAGWQLRMA
jgi:hypothetical protein